MSRALRKVVIVNTADEGGGAERMSMTVLDRFNELGIDTWLLVGDKRTDHPRVMPFFASPYIDYRPYDKPLRLAAIEWRRRIQCELGIEDFNFTYAHRILDLTGSPPDLVLCHNLHGGYFDLRAVAGLSRRVPVVLQLFDSWLLTGHCASALGCARWQTGCGHCPDLKIPPMIRRDATAFNWRRKRRIFQEARVFVCSESQWMINRAQQSLLAPAIAEWKVIPSGVDLETFCRGSRADARRELGLASDVSVVLYVANAGPANAYKDWVTVRQALVELARRDPGRRLVVLAAGTNAPDERLSANIVIRWIGYVRSRTHMAELYRAADLLVHASPEETFGVSLAEALACGTPVVLASVGGAAEMVEDNITGLVVPPRDPAKLADAIARLVGTPTLRDALGTAGAERAKARYDARETVAALHAWCAEICERWVVAR